MLPFLFSVSFCLCCLSIGRNSEDYMLSHLLVELHNRWPLKDRNGYQKRRPEDRINEQQEEEDAGSFQ